MHIVFNHLLQCTIISIDERRGKQKITIKKKKNKLQQTIEKKKEKKNRIFFLLNKNA